VVEAAAAAQGGGGFANEESFLREPEWFIDLDQNGDGYIQVQ